MRTVNISYCFITKLSTIVKTHSNQNQDKSTPLALRYVVFFLLKHGKNTSFFLQGFDIAPKIHQLSLSSMSHCAIKTDFLKINGIFHFMATGDQLKCFQLDGRVKKQF